MKNMKNKRQELLEYREELLNKNSNILRYSTPEKALYLEKLNEVPLTKYQEQFIIGINLGDGSVIFPKGPLKNVPKTLALKFNQVKKNNRYKYVDRFQKVLKEYISNNNGPWTLNNETSLEIGTMQNKAFANLLIPIFYVHGRKKIINIDALKPYITPVSVAEWFCCDGARVDRGAKQGKGIEFSTHGFTEQENLQLALALKEKLNLEINVAKAKDKYYLKCSGTSYETFIEVVGPYIPEEFHYKVPLGRVENSLYGYGNEAFRQKHLGSKFLEYPSIDDLIYHL